MGVATTNKHLAVGILDNPNGHMSAVRHGHDSVYISSLSHMGMGHYGQLVRLLEQAVVLSWYHWWRHLHAETLSFEQRLQRGVFLQWHLLLLALAPELYSEC